MIHVNSVCMLTVDGDTSSNTSRYRFNKDSDRILRDVTTTNCCTRLTWSREQALWTQKQWSSVMFSEECRFSLQSDSHRTLIWRAPGTRYHQESTIEQHRYGGEGWLVWGGLFLVPELTCMFRV
ncbi:HTH_Tnp_Tc3_2 domain-containing protein [Trichonephila clavipes]|nr:HTH_Tnp_Tc3_2 domain-containing protein [Trichonephila clavipes]